MLFGNGDGTLRGYQSAGGPSGARALAGDDFDADGLVDLAVAHGANLVTLLRNAGDEQFAGAGSHTVGGAPVALAAADVDGDGSTDLVTANRGANDVSVLLGDDDGRFQQQSRIRVGRTPTGLAIGDLDADGTLDLVTANRGSKTVTAMLNGADAPQPVVCLVPAVAHRTVAVAQRRVVAAKCRVRRSTGVSARRTSHPCEARSGPRARESRNHVAGAMLAGRDAVRVDTAVTLLVSKGRRR